MAARLVARMFDAKLWIHVQDFELEVAQATGLLAPAGPLAALARRFERWSLRADRISTISPQMCARLAERGIAPERIVEFRNWASIDPAAERHATSLPAAHLGIDRPHVALYSGNLALKQGIDVVVEAARHLAGRRDLLFAICGEGPYRDVLRARARDLDNVRFLDLQPPGALAELLATATVHLLPQIAGAADLVLPSKLTNMLASGRPVVATAHPGTGLAQEVEGCGIVTPPGDAAALAAAVEALIDDPVARAALGAAARVRAAERWDRGRILARVEQQMRECIAG